MHIGDVRCVFSETSNATERSGLGRNECRSREMGCVHVPHLLSRDSSAASISDSRVGIRMDTDSPHRPSFFPKKTLNRSVFMDPCNIVIVPCQSPPRFSGLLNRRLKSGGTRSNSVSSPSSRWPRLHSHFFSSSPETRLSRSRSIPSSPISTSFRSSSSRSGIPAEASRSRYSLSPRS